MSEYTHTVTIAVPETLIPDANHLALLLGESAADIGTFNATSHTYGNTGYAIAHASVKPIFIEPTQTGVLPDTPTHAESIVDREAAQRAFNSLGTPGGIRIAFDVSPHEQFAEWGLTPTPVEEPI